MTSSNKKSIKTVDRVLYFILIGLKKTIEVLPRKPVLKLGIVIGRTAYFFLPSRRRITIGNISRAFPENNSYWCRLTAKKVFENFGRNIMEFIKFSSGRFYDAVETKGLEKIKGPGVLLMGHLGHWEITGVMLPVSGTELFPVGRRVHSAAFDMLVDDLRTAFGSHHIPYRNSIREILRKLKDGKNICVLVDQRMKSGLPVEFFGRPVWATQLVPVLYRRTGIRVTPASSRHVNGKISITYEEPIRFVTDNDSLKSDFINTQMQMRWLEGKIREKPDEWFWMHNFWKDYWPAVFFDRDGTINRDHGYVSSINDFEFLPDVMDSMRRMRKAGFLLVIVTNQSGIARGYYSESEYRKLNAEMLEMFADEGVIIDRVYHCPHHPDDGCLCRKPSQGMGIQARRELNINFSRSFMVGDKPSDIEFGRSLGMRTILIAAGEKVKNQSVCTPDHTANGMKEAADLVTGKQAYGNKS